MTASGAVVVLDARTSLMGAVKSDLALGGFDVVAVQWKHLAPTARERRPVAIVVPPQVPWPVSRALKDPGLRGARVVVTSLGRSRVPRAVPGWPLVRADAYVSEADVKTPGGVSEAVRAAIARAPVAPAARREHLGEALWYVGSALALVGPFAFFAAVVAAPFAGGTPRHMFLWALSVYGAGVVLLDLGSRLARSLRLGLRWDSWMWVVLMTALALSLSAIRWAGWIPA